jgi:hypothetical protein
MSPQGNNQEPEKIDRLRRAMYSRAIEPTLKERDRRALSQDPDMVKTDWPREERQLAPTMVAPRGMNIARSLLMWLLGFAILFFVAASAYFLFFFTFGGGSNGASASNIDIAITGPSQVASGNKTELQIAITNGNTASLELTRLIVSYPNGTRSPADFTTAQPQWTQSLGTIHPGETRRGVAYAVLNGTQGSQGSIKVELQYRLNGSNAVFTASNDYAFTYGSAPLSVVVEGNTQTVSGQPIELTATISSNATTPIKGALVQVRLPFGFKLTSSQPSLDGKSIAKLGDMNPGSQKQIVIEGVLTGATSDARVFTFTAGTYASATSTTLDVPLASNAYTIGVAQPFLGLSLNVGDGAQSSQPVIVLKPGQKVVATIAYKNNLPTAINDATIIAQFSGYQINGSTVATPDGFYRSNDGTIIWNKSTVPVLHDLAPGATGILTFSFVAPTNDELTGKPSPNLTVALSAAGTRVSDAGVIETLQSTAEKKFTLSSNVVLAANGLYYSSPYGSTGPMPPKVGVETTYAIVFTLLNTTNPIKNARVTAVMPVYVRSTGKTSPSYEKIHFNQTNGAVTWDVGDIAAGVGNGSQPRQAAFEVGFTPSISQLGQKPVLVQDIVFTGTDSVTGQNIYISSTSSSDISNVSIDLKGDSIPSPVDPAVTQ